MNHYVRKITTSFFALMMVVGLSGCGSSLQKPSGLEDDQSQQITLEKNGNSQLATADEREEQVEDVEVNPLENIEDVQTVEKDDANITSTEREKAESSTNNHRKDKKNTTNKQEEKTSAKSTSTKKPSNQGTNDSKKVEEKPTTKKADKDTEKLVEKPKKTKEPDENKEPEPAPKKSKIVYSIVISKNEVPLQPTEMEIKDYDTVLQALISITMEKAIHMDYRGGQGPTAYVQGMGNVYEFDRGQGSGWMYRVNGIFPDRGAGVVPLLDGDRVEWLYTTNLGEDLGADLQPFRR